MSNNVIRTSAQEMELRAIAAAKQVLGREIIIQSDADFTPPGKRKVRVVRHQLNGRRAEAHLRWYVAGKAFRSLPLTNSNVALSNSWKGSAACVSDSHLELL